MATSSRQRRQFQSVFETVICATATVNPGSLADGVGEDQAVTITGAALGDFVLVAPGVSLASASGQVSVTAYVSAANTVTVRLQNESTATIDIASSTWKFCILRPSGLFGTSG